MTVLIHKTYTLADHHTAMTLCGLRIRTDHEHTHHVKTSEQWVSCPLCETALLLDTLDTSTDDGTGHDSRSPTGWNQPAMF